MNKSALINRITKETVAFCVENQSLLETDVQKYILNAIEREHEEEYLSVKSKAIITKKVLDSIYGLGPLQPFIDDPEINEIMVNSEQEIFIERKGVIEKATCAFHTRKDLRDIIQRIVSKVNRRVNESKPIVDARLSDGSRVNIVLPPIALKGPTMTIRKFGREAMTLKRLIEYQTITKKLARFLSLLIKSKYNIFISGGTSSGKTSFLNALSQEISANERIITIEDSAELKLSHIENLVKLETREGNQEGVAEINMRDLIKTSLRMRPDRIIIGEVRGGEALEMLQAMNTGHDGSLSTGHGNSAQDMLSRIETMVLTETDMPLIAVRKQILSAIDILIHLGRYKDGTRRVLEVSEVIGLKGDGYLLNRVFKFDEEKLSKIVYTGNFLKSTTKLSILDVNVDKLKGDLIDK